MVNMILRLAFNMRRTKTDKECILHQDRHWSKKLQYNVLFYCLIYSWDNTWTLYREDVVEQNFIDFNVQNRKKFLHASYNYIYTTIPQEPFQWLICILQLHASLFWCVYKDDIRPLIFSMTTKNILFDSLANLIRIRQ